MPTQTKEEKANELKEKRDAVHKEIEAVYKNLKTSREIFQRYEREWLDLRKQFESLDYELAMMDGRFKTLPGQTSKYVKKEKSVTVDLNKAQIIAIAEALGVQIDIE